MNMELLKMDLKQRFLNYETAKGLFFVAAGLVITYTAWFYIQFTIQIVATTFGIGFFCVEGFRKIFVNRVKQAIKQDQLKQEALKASGAVTETAKVASAGESV